MAHGVRDTALILGGAETLSDDIWRAEALVGGEWPGPVIAVNEAGTIWPGRLHHWVTLHPEHFARWEAERAENVGSTGYLRWARRGIPTLADREARSWGGGSSGLLAVSVARTIGVERAVLCGMPMDERPHFHGRDDGEPWPHADTHWKWWRHRADWLKGWVRSMSGRTRDLLGEPTLVWLRGE